MNIVILPSSIAVARAVAAANQAAPDQGAYVCDGWIGSKAESGLGMHRGPE